VFYGRVAHGGSVRLNFMKQVYSSPDNLQIELIRSMLEVAKIKCEVRNGAVSRVMVGAQFAPELWVREEDYDEAVRLVSEPHSEP
jgi:hypothetical protein